MRRSEGRRKGGGDREAERLKEKEDGAYDPSSEREGSYEGRKGREGAIRMQASTSLPAINTRSSTVEPFSDPFLSCDNLGRLELCSMKENRWSVPLPVLARILLCMLRPPALASRLQRMEHIIFDVENLLTQHDESHGQKGIGILHSEKHAGCLLALRLEVFHFSPSP